MSITNVQMLAAGLEDGNEFEVEINGVTFNFFAVKRCPATSKDHYGHQNQCSGVWYDYLTHTQGVVSYRFCPKVPDALGALNDRLWQSITGNAEYAHSERQRRDKATAEHRRQKAALILLEACERVERMANGDTQYLRGVKAAIRKAKEAL